MIKVYASFRDSVTYLMFVLSLRLSHIVRKLIPVKIKSTI